jgi:hypothetical protein
MRAVTTLPDGAALISQVRRWRKTVQSIAGCAENRARSEAYQIYHVACQLPLLAIDPAMVRGEHATLRRRQRQ